MERINSRASFHDSTQDIQDVIHDLHTLEFDDLFRDVHPFGQDMSRGLPSPEPWTVSKPEKSSHFVTKVDGNKNMIFLSPEYAEILQQEEPNVRVLPLFSPVDASGQCQVYTDDEIHHLVTRLEQAAKKQKTSSSSSSSSASLSNLFASTTFEPSREVFQVLPIPVVSSLPSSVVPFHNKEESQTYVSTPPPSSSSSSSSFENERTSPIYEDLQIWRIRDMSMSGTLTDKPIVKGADLEKKIPVPPPYLLDSFSKRVRCLSETSHEEDEAEQDSIQNEEKVMDKTEHVMLKVKQEEEEEERLETKQESVSKPNKDVISPLDELNVKEETKEEKEEESKQDETKEEQKTDVYQQLSDELHAKRRPNHFVEYVPLSEQNVPVFVQRVFRETSMNCASCSKPIPKSYTTFRFEENGTNVCSKHTFHRECSAKLTLKHLHHRCSCCL
jgi:hypothetical protein